MKICKNIISILLLQITFLSCNDNITEPQLSDDELLKLAYSSEKWPSDFYQEELLGGSIYYENTVSTKPLDKRESVWIQLCTDNIDTAKKWSDLSSQYSSYYRELESERETEKYYEFRRVYSVYPNDILLSRVHKSSYLDRSMYDFFKKEGTIAIFKKPNFTISDVKELIEYLWFTGHYDLGGMVYKSTIEENDLEYTHSIYEISITYGDWGVQDMIYLIKNTFHVEKSNGEITFESETVKEVGGKYN